MAVHCSISSADQPRTLPRGTRRNRIKRGEEIATKNEGDKEKTVTPVVGRETSRGRPRVSYRPVQEMIKSAIKTADIDMLVPRELAIRCLDRSTLPSSLDDFILLLVHPVVIPSLGFVIPHTQWYTNRFTRPFKC